jgi:hypothetical protein
LLTNHVKKVDSDQTILEYVTVAEDNSRKLTMEVLILKHEKEMLSNASFLGRKEAEDILQRVLAELEEKAGVIMDERGCYEET